MNKREWYSQSGVLKEIIGCVANKETAFIDKNHVQPTVRYLFPKFPQMLLGLLHHKGFSRALDLSFLDVETWNLYHSLANYSNKTPSGGYTVGSKLKQYEDIKKDFGRYWTGYDWGVDIDSDDWRISKKHTIAICKLLEQFKVPYSVKWSGKKGFHIYCPYKYLPEMPLEKLPEFLGELNHNLKVIFGFCIDVGVAKDVRRVWKMPYSYDRGLIALPLTDSQLNHFKLSFVTPETIRECLQLGDRGLLIRTHGLTEEQLKENMLKFCKEYGG